MLIGLVILSLIITDFPIWGRATSITASVVAFLLFIRWHSSLEEIKKTKKVVLEGCNGEWAQQCYFPFLVAEADKRNTELWALDFGSQIKLSSPSVTALWQSSRGKGKSCYLDKSSSRVTLDKPDEVSYVFVVTPDRCHADVAAFWLERLAPEGKIFIEKPLDANVAAAERLGGKESIFAFDHYLARAYPFLLESARYLKQIGGVRKIEFHLLEDFDRLKRRAETLDKGAIFDLFCHVLAVVCAAVSHKTTCPATELENIKKLDKVKVKAAQYADCPISGDTFSRINFTVNRDIEVVSDVGYYIGNKQDKFMKLHGTKGRIELNFVRDEFAIFDAQDKLLKKEKLLADSVETYLEKLLPGKKQPLSLPGVLSFDAALEILKILDKAKQQIGKMPVYQYNDSIDEILEILGEGELN